MYFVYFISKCGAFDVDMLLNRFLAKCESIAISPITKSGSLRHADILRGSSRVPRAGTRDEPPKNVCEGGYKSN